MRHSNESTTRKSSMPNLPTLFHRVHIRRATKGTAAIVQIYHDTYGIVKRWTWRLKGMKRGGEYLPPGHVRWKPWRACSFFFAHRPGPT